MKSISFYTENCWKCIFFFLVLSLTEQCYLYFDQFDSGEMEAGKDAVPSSSRPPSGKPSSRPTSAKPGIYTYQINTLLYKHIMTCFWLVFIKIVQLESHTIIGYQERSFLAVLYFFYTEKQLPGNTWPIKIFIFIVKDRKIMHFKW